MHCRVLVASLLFVVPVAAQQPSRAEVLQALAAMPVSPPLLRGTEVEVVDAAGAPAANAVLVAIPRLRDQDRPALARLHAQWRGDTFGYTQAKAAQFGARVAVDQSGHARLGADFIGELLAVEGEALAWQYLDEYQQRRPRGVRLVLQVPRRFHVLVVDVEGRPAAGVRVGFAEGDGRLVQNVATTADDGTATVTSGFDDLALARGQKLAVQAALQQPLTHELPAKESDVVRLVMPATGSVRVELANFEDAMQRRPRLRVMLQRDNGLHVDLVNDVSGTASATLPYVQPGVPLVAQVFLEGLAFSFVVPVPEVEVGHETRVVVDRAHGPPWVVLRVVDQQGKPVARAMFEIACKTGRGRHSTRGASDAEGRLEIAPPPGYLQDSTLDLRLVSEGSSNPEAAAEVPLPALQPGRNDLGDVRIDTVPILIAGRLLDRRGEPVVGVVVSIDRGVGGSSAPSDAEGHFAIRMPLPHPDEVRVVLRSDDCYLQERPVKPREGPVFAAGRTDVRLVVCRAARMLVRMPPLPENTLMQLRVEATSKQDDVPFATQLGANATQLRLPPGRWDLSLRFGEGFAEVMRIEDVVADEGVENHDPRLLDLDWRRFATAVTVHAIGPDGKPLPRGDLGLLMSVRGRSGHWGMGLQGGVATALAPSDGSGWLILDPQDASLCKVRLDLTKAEQTVQVPRAPKLSVQLSAMPELPAGCTLQVHLTAALPEAEIVTAAVDAQGKAEIVAQELGAQRLQLFLRVGNSSMPVQESSVELAADAERRIEVTAAVREAIVGAAQQLQRLHGGR